MLVFWSKYLKALRTNLNNVRPIRSLYCAYITALLSIILTPVAFGNMVGSDTQNFNTTSSAEDYVTVYSAKNMGKGKIHLGLFMNAAVNTLPYFENGEPGSRFKYNDSVTAAELSVGYGLLDNVDLGLLAPVTLIQHVKDDSSHGEYASGGFTEIRALAKFGLVKESMFGLATIVSTNLNLTEDSPYQGKNDPMTYNIELAGDLYLGLIEVGANVGYRLKNGGSDIAEDSPISAYKNQFIASAAVAYELISQKSKLIGEIFTSSPSSPFKDESDRHTTRAEMLASIKTFYSEQIVYYARFGSELRHSVSSADWRIYGGLHYMLGEKSTSSESRSPVKSNRIPDYQPDDVIVVNKLHFKFDSAELDSEINLSYIDKLMRSLNNTKGFETLVIEGHTCSLGTARYNKNLSRKRALKIKRMLVSDYGVNPKKIIPMGYGESHPVATNKSETGRERNRRVEFKIYRK